MTATQAPNEEAFAALMARLRSDQNALNQFQHDPAGVVKAAGIQLVDEPPTLRGPRPAMNSALRSSQEHGGKSHDKKADDAAGKKVLAELARIEAFTRAMTDLAKMRQAALAVAESQQVRADLRWWGLNIYTPESVSAALATAGSGMGTLGGLVAAMGSALLASSAVPGANLAAAVAGALVAAAAAKGFQIKLTDQGHGLDWPVTWAQWAGVLAAVPGGPVAIYVALLLFLHPVPH